MQGRSRLVGVIALGAALIVLPLWLSSYHPTGDAVYDALARETLRSFPTTHEPWVRRLAQQIGIALPEREVRSLDAQALLDRYGDRPQGLEAALLAARFDGEDSEVDRRALVEQAVADGRATVGMFAAVDPRDWYMDDEDKALELCDHAIGLDPENSYFYYIKALILVSLGELEEAGHVCATGNSAPRNEVVWPAPVARLLARGPGLGPQNEVAAGFIYELCDDSTRWLRCKSGFKDLEVALLIGMPPAYFDGFITMARRIGQMERQSLTGCQTAKACSWVLLGTDSMGDQLEYDDNGEFLFDLTPPQEREAQAIRAQLAQLDAEFWRAYPQTPGGTGLGFTPGYELPAQTRLKKAGNDSALAGLALGYGTVSSADLRAIAREAREQRELVQRMRRYFDCLDPPPLGAWSRGELAGEASAG